MAEQQLWDAEEVYRRFAPAVLAYLRTADAATYEDLFGDVFVNVARSIRRFRGNENALRRWLFTLARNRLRDEQRRRARHPGNTREPTESDRTTPGIPDPFDPALEAALGELTDDQREVITLRFFADLSLDDVAQMTQRSVGAVKSLQHRALESLSVRLQHVGRADEPAQTGTSSSSS